jgi:hypothetical protein
MASRQQSRTVGWHFREKQDLNLNTFPPEAVKYMSRVKGVFKNMNLKPIVQPAAVKNMIEKAIKRVAEFDAQDVMVSASSGKVTDNRFLG